MNNNIYETVVQLQQALLNLATHDKLRDDVKHILMKKLQMDLEAMIRLINEYNELGDKQ